MIIIRAYKELDQYSGRKMRMKDILVVGLGSMGKRRVRLLQAREDVKTIVGVDGRDDRRAEAINLGIQTAVSIEVALNMYPQISCAFVCTSPLSHAAVIGECLRAKLHVFTEINLVSDEYDENIMLAEENNKVLFLSSTPMYRKETQFIRNQVKEIGENVNYIYHVGQYLPDWHPWERINDFFVGDKRTNGCREILGIELPWMVDTFGDIDKIFAAHNKMSKLPLDFDDNYFVQIQHKNGNKGIFIADVVCRNAVRNLEVYSENLYLKWDGKPTGLEQYDFDERALRTIELYKQVDYRDGYQATIIENAYAAEIDEFFACIRGQAKQRHGFEKDKQIIHWMDRIEKS